MWWIVGILIVIAIISSIAEAVGGWGKFFAIIAGIILLIAFFNKYSWDGVFTVIKIILGVVCLVFVVEALSDIIKKHDQARKETVEIELKLKKEAQQQKDRDEYNAAMQKHRRRTVKHSSDIERPSTKQHSKDYFSYTDIPMINGTCDAVGEPEKFEVTFYTNGNRKISFEVKEGQISSYSFLSQTSKKVGTYEVS